MKICHIFIGFALILLFGVCQSCSKKSAPFGRQPNIILIMADDLGYECLGCDGGTSYATPNLDRMAETGIRFLNCFSQPLCTPSRVQIMTGKYNSRNYTDFGILHQGEKTFGTLLKKAGYATAIAGKWQLYGSTGQKELRGTGSLPGETGFDTFCLWQLDKVGSRYADPVIYQNRLTPDTILNAYGPDIFWNFIETFLTNHQKEPFFLYYPMVLPHSPHVPTPATPEWETGRFKHNNLFFKDMVAYMDKNVGRILQKLEDLDLRSNTLVIFIGDNGTNRAIVSMMGQQEVQGGKGLTLLTGTHVPLIVNMPEHVKPGQVTDAYVDFTDFLPTLLEIAGIEKPDDFFMDGSSFAGVLTGAPFQERKWVYSYYDPKWAKFKYARFVYTPEYKLYDNGRFFNLLQDQKELTPLEMDALTPGQREVATTFGKVLEHLKEVPPK